ncbi:hypothetical protein ES703_35259 [subsurface metagenome]
MEDIRQAWDLLSSSIEQSQDLLCVISELQDTYDHLSTVEAEGE